MKQYKQHILVSIIIALSVIGYFWLASFKKNTDKKSDLAPIKYVSTSKVFYKDASFSIALNGKIIAASPINLVAEANGRLLQGSIPLKKAQKFKKGDILFSIESSDTKLNLQAQKSDFITALTAIIPDLRMDFKAEYTVWENYLNQLNIYNKFPKLPESQNKTLKNFLTTKKIFSLYYNIQANEEKLGKTNFVAPYNGSFADLKIEAGAAVSQNTNLGRIISSADLEVEIPVKVEDIHWLKIGQNLQLYNLGENPIASANVSRISESIDANTQSITVFAHVNTSKENTIFEGMYVNIKLGNQSLKNVIEISRSAIFQENKVWLVENNKLQLKEVFVLKTFEDKAFIKGLKEGETIVNESISNAIEGDIVKIK